MISIVTLVWNHCNDVTKPFIEHFYQNTNRDDVELIVINNGSNDNTREYLDSLPYPKFRKFHLPTNTGYARGNNIGFSKVNGEYVCFINNDVLIKDPEWIDKFIKAAKAQKNRALLGTQYVDFNDQTRFKNISVPYLNGWCLFAHKKVFDTLVEDGHLFDDGFGLAYFEDVDLSYRASDAGFKLVEVPANLVHLGSQSSDQIDINKQTQRAKRHYTNKMTINHLKKTGKKRIVFYNNDSFPFIDSDYEGKGVGGSQASLILLSREFAKQGWQTEVYTSTEITGTYNGVEYHNLSEFNYWDYCDVFVLFRNISQFLPYINADKKIFLSCDQYTSGIWKKEVFPFVDKIVAISPYHMRYMDMVYGPIGDKLTYLDLGVNMEDYEKPEKKIPGKLIFCSVPKRGLAELIPLFNAIKAEVPGVKLYITSDYRLWGLDHPDNKEFKDMVGDRADIEFLGKVSRKDLVYHQKTAELMVYPCIYEECFCISALECIAAGAIPITTDIGALPTTVAESGIIIKGTPGTYNYGHHFVYHAKRLLTDKPYAKELRESGMKRIKENYNYTTIYNKWIELFTSLEKKGGDTMVTCETCKKTFKSSYHLNKHSAKYHKDAVEIPAELPVAESPKPQFQLLKFKQFVQCNINGNSFSGREMEVPYDMVPAVVDTIRTAYGPDVFEF